MKSPRQARARTLYHTLGKIILLVNISRSVSFNAVTGPLLFFYTTRS